LRVIGNQSLRLPGQYFDPETGNNHNGFRDYSGTLTRYVQSDPLGLGGGMNTYQYVKGNPFKYTDRLGLDPLCKEGSVMCGSGPGPGPIWHFLNPDDDDSDPDPIDQIPDSWLPPYSGGGLPPAWQPFLFPQNGGGGPGGNNSSNNGGGGSGGNGWYYFAGGGTTGNDNILLSGGGTVNAVGGQVADGGSGEVYGGVELTGNGQTTSILIGDVGVGPDVGGIGWTGGFGGFVTGSGQFGVFGYVEAGLPGYHQFLGGGYSWQLPSLTK
jgi:RHS repeat-associated protein